MQNVKAGDVFKQMVRWQLLAIVVVAALSGVMAGLHGVVSALAGGGSVIAGVFVSSIIARTNENKNMLNAFRGLCVLVGMA